MRSNIFRILSCLLLAGLAWAQGSGVITGTVLDENGSPVAKARVHIGEKDVLVVHRLINFHDTDADGHFRIAHVPWGTYLVLAGKEDAGYPDTQGTFYSGGGTPTVVISEASPVADVTLNLGPKAGVLELEPVTDAITGKEIRSAAIRLKRAENPDLFIYTSATQRRLLIPAFTEVLIAITAGGYKPWPGPDRAATEGRIFLNPEEVQKLQVTLQPEGPQSASRENKPN